MPDDYIVINLKDKGAKKDLLKTGVGVELIDEAFNEFNSLKRRKKEYKKVSEKQKRLVLNDYGFTSIHSEWLLRNDREELSILDWCGNFSVFIKTDKGIFDGKEREFTYMFAGMSVPNDPEKTTRYELSFDEIITNHKMMPVEKIIHKDLEIEDIINFIYPMSSETFKEFKMYKVVDLIESGKLRPVFYPWSNPKIVDESCKPERITNDRRSDYIELSSDCKRWAVINVKKYGKHFPLEAEVWGSYFKTDNKLLGDRKTVEELETTKYLKRARWIWDNWGAYDKRGKSEKRGKTKIYSYVGFEFGRSESHVREAIKQAFEKHIK